MSTPDSTTLHHRTAMAIITVTFVAGSLSYSLHAASFLHPKAAVFAAGAFLLGCLMLRSHGPQPWDGIRVFLPLWLYLFVGAARALLGGGSTAPALESALMLTPALLFASMAHPYLDGGRVRRLLLLGSVPVGGLALAQYFGALPGYFPVVPTYTQPMYSVFGNQDLLGAFMAIGVIAAVQGILRPQRADWGSLAAILVLFPAWILAGSRTAWLGGAVGLLVCLAVTPDIPRRRLAWLCAGGLAAALAGVLFSPVDTIERVAGTFAPDDEGGWFRLWFWDATVRMFLGAPLTGVGLGAFSLEAPQYLGEAFKYSAWIQHKPTELTIYHAHSDPLEALAETGLIGALFLFWMGWRIRRGRGQSWGALAALLTFACFNATVISPAHAAAGLMLMGRLTPRPGHVETDHPEPPWARVPAAAGGGMLLAFVLTLLLIPGVHLRSAQTAHLDGRGSVAAYDRVPLYSVLAPEARASLGQLHAEREDWESAVAAYEQALIGLDTGRIHLELGALYHRLHDPEAALPHLAKAVERWPWNFDAWRLYLAAMPESERAETLREASRWLDEAAVARLKEILELPG